MLPEIGDCYVLRQTGSAAKQNEQFWIAARAWIDTRNAKNKLANQGIYEMKVVLGKQARFLDKSRELGVKNCFNDTLSS